jgi:hypothetical protein
MYFKYIFDFSYILKIFKYDVWSKLMTKNVKYLVTERVFYFICICITFRLIFFESLYSSFITSNHFYASKNIVAMTATS